MTPMPTGVRLMLTVDDRRCRFGCQYCFAGHSQYEGVPSIADAERDPQMAKAAEVVYPACDVDLFARRDWNEVLTRCLKFERSISVSTKAPVTREMALPLARIASQLRRQGLVLKVGVSVSTKRRIANLEPRTSDYRARIAGLDLLRQHEIETALILRPLLEEVADGEYLEVLDDAAPVVDRVLLGGEWLDADGHRGTGETSSGSVSWLSGAPVWPSRPQEDRIQSMARAAEARGLQAFTSDLQLMRSLAGSR